MRKRLLTLFAFIMLVFLSMGGYTTSAAAYSDISGHWAQTAIERWSELGVLQGSDGKFRPNDKVTRAELAAILNRMLKYPEITKNPYNDVRIGDWFYADILSLAEYGIVVTDESSVRPNEALTREEAVFSICRAFGVMFWLTPPDQFPDISDSFAATEINYMALNRFINGDPGGAFRPGDSITRAEVVTILDNMIDVWITEPGTYNDVSGGCLITCGNVNISSVGSADYFISPNVAAESIGISISKNSQIFCVGFTVDNIALSGEKIDSNSVHLTRYAVDSAIKNLQSKFSGGSGTENDPFLISNQEQLNLLRFFCEEPFGDCYYRLTNDIALTGTWKPIQKDMNHWEYVFKDGKPRPDRPVNFQGNLDGGGHTISGLYVNEPPNSEAGLFERFYGTVKNLNISGEIIIKETDGLYAGALAGLCSADVSNCSADIKISAYSESPVPVPNEIVRVGGLTGSGGRFANCSVKAVINVGSTTELYTGGISGSANKIEKCDVTVSITADGGKKCVAGGIVGRLYTGTAADCTAQADILASGRMLVVAGGIAGDVENSTINGCVSSGKVRAESKATDKEQNSSFSGGISGLLYAHSIISSCSSSAEISAVGGYYSYAGGISGNVSRKTGLSDNQTDGTEISLSYATGNVKAEDALMQNNAGGAVGQVAFGEVYSCWSSGGVSAQGEPGYFNAVGGFAGSCYEGGAIRDCYTTGNVTGDDGTPISFGGFAGRLGGNISNCYATGKVEVTLSSGKTDRDFAFFGSGRGGERLSGCFDLLDCARGYPVCISGNSEEKIAVSELSKQSTYSSRGWDFGSIWKMSGSSYQLPILAGVGEEAQLKQTVPQRLK